MDYDVRNLLEWEWDIWRLSNCNPATYDYLLSFNETYHAVYMQVPKAASLTLRHRLGRSDVQGETPAGDFRSLRQTTDSGRKPPSIAALLQSDEYYRFTFVRNPYTRVLAAYIHKVLEDRAAWNDLHPRLGLGPEKPSFKAFLHHLAEQDPVWIDIHFRSQASLLLTGIVDYHYIGRFETLDRDFATICRHLGLPPAPAEENVLFHATGATSRVDEFYDPATRNLVYRLYQDDFRTFCYAR